MDYQVFFKEVADTMVRMPEWRYGQTVFNTLYRMDPEAANRVRGTAIDPYYWEADNNSFVDFWNWFYNGLA